MKLPRLDLNTGEPIRYKSASGTDRRGEYPLEPVNLADLMRRAGPLANAVKAEVEWGAIVTWQMNGSKSYEDAIAAAGIEGGQASSFVQLVRSDKRHENGWPSLSGIAGTPALYGLSADAQCEARQVAAKVYALWEQAGRPHVDARACKYAYRYLLACVTSGLIDPLPNIRAMDLLLAPARAN